MFGENVIGGVYLFEMLSLFIWILITWRSMGQLKKFQHEEWMVKVIRYYALYCLFEFVRVVDCVYTDLDEGHIYSIWGFVPWGPRMYAWVLRDVVMFRAAYFYLEHSFVWTHVCLGEKVPRTVLRVQAACFYLGNVIFAGAGTLYTFRNDQFWQPVCALGQVPPNVALFITCFTLRGFLKRVPDCKERTQATTINTLLRVNCSVLLLVFPIWCCVRMIHLYGKPLPCIESVPYGSSIFWTPPPSIFRSGRTADVAMEVVECSIGWAFSAVLLLRPLHVPQPGESLVVNSQETGLAVARAISKKAG